MLNTWVLCQVYVDCCIDDVAYKYFLCIYTKIKIIWLKLINMLTPFFSLIKMLNSYRIKWSFVKNIIDGRL